MKKIVVLLLCLSVLASCSKDKKNTPGKDAEPLLETGTVNINVVTYDSLGDLESDFSGVQVNLYQTAFTSTTNSSGKVSFTNVPFGKILPTLVRYGYDGPPVSVELNSANATASLPCAKFSAYKLLNLNGQAINADSITLNVGLDRPVPAGKVCKLAILYSSTGSSPNNFEKADIIVISTQNISKLNIAALPNLKAALAGLKNGDSFYINAIAVSYGIFQSNLLNKQVLLGDNIYPQQNINLTKTW